MDFYAVVSSVMVLIPMIAILAAFGIARGRYKNSAGAGPFFFEDGKFVLNTGAPWPIPVEKIDHIELKYSTRELESRISYNLTVKVVRKDGSAKSCFYRGSTTGKLPAHMAAEIEANGLRCVVDGQ